VATSTIAKTAAISAGGRLAPGIRQKLDGMKSSLPIAAGVCAIGDGALNGNS
jgi:hypothetical protein